jgi:hypothetical protein
VSSNSKWLYIFEELEVECSPETKAEVKFLTENTCFEYTDLFSSVFESTYFDGMSGPVEYSQIEWVKVYTSFQPNFNKQVETEYFEGGFVIYGYKRSEA